MKNINLYEKIPESSSIIRIDYYNYFRIPSFSMHWHEHLEIHYIIEGTSIIRVENEIIRANAGEIIIINNNELHAGMGGNCKFLCLIIPPHFAHNNNIILNRVVKDVEISKLFEYILNEYVNSDQANDIAITGYSALILAKLYRKYTFKTLTMENYKAYSQRTLLLNEISKYIHENFSENITLSDISEKFHINQFHFCHIFKEFTGKTFKEYLNEVKVDNAEKLLLTTDVPISEVGFLCGFEDSNYFSRKFKQIKGKTPREMRKTNVE